MAEQPIPYPIPLDIKVRQGVSWDCLVTWDRREEGEIVEVYDLSQYTILFQIRHDVNDTNAILDSTKVPGVVEITDAQAGQFTLSFSAFLTADLPVLKDARYDLLMQDLGESQRVIHFMTGKFAVEQIAVKKP